MPTAEQFRRWAEELEQVATRAELGAATVRRSWGAGPIRGGRLREVVAQLVEDVDGESAVAAAALREVATACRRRAVEAAA